MKNEPTKKGNYMENNIILSTLETLPNMDVESHVGLVSGTASISKNPLSTWLKNLKNLFGGDVASVDEMFEETKKSAIDKMIDDAKHKGANAIVCIQFETIRLGESYCEIHVYGSGIKATQF